MNVAKSTRAGNMRYMAKSEKNNEFPTSLNISPASPFKKSIFNIKSRLRISGMSFMKIKTVLKMIAGRNMSRKNRFRLI
jgi:hypothetical protein